MQEINEKAEEVRQRIEGKSSNIKKAMMQYFMDSVIGLLKDIVDMKLTIGYTDGLKTNEPGTILASKFHNL